MDNDVKISVCMTFYNESQYIDDAINSVIDQTYNNWEIVVFNDGSKPSETKALHKIISEKSIKCKIIDSNNKGRLTAKLSAFNYANGDLILSLDSDDMFCDKNMFKEIVSSYINNNWDMLIFNSSRSLKTPVNNQRYLSNRHAGKVSIDAYREDFCINDQLNNIAYKCFTKSLFENLKINRTSKMNMAEDRYVSAFLFNEAKTVFLINKPFYFYRENKDSITYTDFTNNRIADKVYCEKQVLKFAELWNINSYSFENNFFEYILYGDILYSFKGNKKIKIRWNIYNNILNSKPVINEVEKFNHCRIKLYKRIGIKLFLLRMYLLLDVYFVILGFLKSVKSFIAG